MDPKLSVELLDRYIAGTCTDGERIAVERWLAEDPQRSLAALEHALSFDSRRERDRVARVWERIEAKTHHPSTHAQDRLRLHAERQSTSNVVRSDVSRSDVSRSDRHTRIPTRISRGRGVGLVAATVLCMAGIGWYVTGRSNESHSQSSALASRDYHTAPGQRATVTLADGTRVILGVDSKLHTQAGFGTRERVVTLDGDAIFEITQASGVPFIVQTSRVDARVLGTRFAMRAYATDSTAYVAVDQGRVAVRRRDGTKHHASHRSAANDTADTAFVLGRGDLVAADPARGVVLSHGAVLGPYLGWSDGQLVFDKLPLRDVMRCLERWYGVQFTLATPALATRRLTASFDGTTAPDVVAQLIATTLGLRIERHAQHIIFH